VRPRHPVASTMASHPLPMITSSMTYDWVVDLFAVVLPRPRPLSLSQSPSTLCPMRLCPPSPPSLPSIKCSLRAHDDCWSATAHSFALSPSRGGPLGIPPAIPGSQPWARCCVRPRSWRSCSSGRALKSIKRSAW
jgi:hypothetical protein